MKAGRELDALIAEKVFGFALGGMSEEDAEPSIIVNQSAAWFDVIPYYSTDMNDAWDVMEKMRGCVPLKLWYDDTMMQWCCIISKGSSVSDLASIAICLAALKAMEEK